MQNMNSQSNLLKSFISHKGWLITILLLWLSACAGVPGTATKPDVDQVSKAAVPVAGNFKVSAAVQKDYANALEYMRAEQYSEAIQILKKVAQKDSRLSGPWVNIGIAYRTLGELDKADEAIETAIKINPKNPYAYNQAGIIRREQGKFSESMSMYQKALAEYPDYASVHLNLAILCDLYLQKIVCAKEHYQAYQTLDSDNNKQVVAWLSDLERRSK